MKLVKTVKTTSGCTHQESRRDVSPAPRAMGKVILPSDMLSLSLRGVGYCLR